MGQVLTKRSFLKMAKDSAAQVELSFHQQGTIMVKVCKCNFLPLLDGNTSFWRAHWKDIVL